MAHTPYTGKSAGVIIKWKTVAIPPWKQVEIVETGKPQTGTKDTTDADSSAYVKIDDPLGGKGSAKTVITISGNLSKSDFNATGFTTWTENDTGTLTIQKGTGAGKDLCTLSDAFFKGLQVKHPHSAVVGYTLKFEKNAAPVWSASLS
jgi:hypothetical protein